MARALLDANVVISAAVHPSGPPGQIIAALLARCSFELSPAIVAGVEAALRLPKVRKYLRNPKDALLWLADLVALADLIEDTGRVVGICSDPDDDVVLAERA